jgi:hypothetical protein
MLTGEWPASLVRNDRVRTRIKFLRMELGNEGAIPTVAWVVRT